MQAALEQQLATVAQAQLLLLLLLAGTSQLQYIAHVMIACAALPFVCLLAQCAEIQCAANAVIGGLTGGGDIHTYNNMIAVALAHIRLCHQCTASTRRVR